jgi:hypothetical protein
MISIDITIVVVVISIICTLAGLSFFAFTSGCAGSGVNSTSSK